MIPPQRATFPTPPQSRSAPRRLTGAPKEEPDPGTPRRSIFFSSRRRHTRFDCDWSSDVCSSDLDGIDVGKILVFTPHPDDAEIASGGAMARWASEGKEIVLCVVTNGAMGSNDPSVADRKSTRLNSSHSQISYAVFCLKKKKHSYP